MQSLTQKVIFFHLHANKLIETQKVLHLALFLHRKNPSTFARQNTWLPLELIKCCKKLKIYLVLGGRPDHQKTIQPERILNNNEKKKATTATELLSDPYEEDKIKKNTFHFPFMQVRISLLWSIILKS